MWEGIPELNKETGYMRCFSLVWSWEVYLGSWIGRTFIMFLFVTLTTLLFVNDIVQIPCEEMLKNETHLINFKYGCRLYGNA